MAWAVCGKCQMMVNNAAKDTHMRLNHPKRLAPPGAVAALVRARQVLAERRAVRREDVARLSAAWDGRAAV